MNIPFSLPLPGNDVISEIPGKLTNTGWLISEPKILALEKESKKLTTAPDVLYLN